MSGLIHVAGEETFWCPNMLSLVSVAGMTLDKCAVLWMGTKWRLCEGRVTPCAVSDFYLSSLQLVLCSVAAVKRLPVHQP